MGQNVLRNPVRGNSPTNQAPGKIKTGARKTARIKENDFRGETNKVWDRQRNLDRKNQGSGNKATVESRAKNVDNL
ncbi:hypothetical protein NDI47_03975 [Microcoleus vaginatus GB1-A2]|uniref:hypothetical protein n=1 Tax=Microcoleus vaginatus TaxID=119532 RepID=UPI0032ACBA9C